MSILKLPYQISVWEDVWDSTDKRFRERLVAIIGSDTSESKMRALEPQFTKNINGVKKLTFDLYKKFLDETTGQYVDNEFYTYLNNERKVKLFYENDWHDFVIKDVKENSKTHKCTFELEDALVQELAKNGFGVTLDIELNNNLGTIKELAERVLEGTDWEVESEAIVERVDDYLVYLRPGATSDGAVDFHNHIVYLCNETHDEFKDIGLSIGDGEDTSEWSVNDLYLGFYSSCTNKNHRFQFIRIPTEDDILTDDKRIILNKNCQYFIEISDPDDGYKEVEASAKMYVPHCFSIVTGDLTGDNRVNEECYISTKYRCARFGFAQRAEYLPEIGRYVQCYKRPSIDNADYYGYEKVEYKSSALLTNIISNPDFKSTSGWTGAKVSKNGNKSTVDNICTEATGIPTTNAKMKLQIGSGGAVFNSGPYDNRTAIGNMEKGDIWILEAKCNKDLGFTLGEYCYDTSKDCYVRAPGAKVTFIKREDSYSNGVRTCQFEVDYCGYSEEEFKKSSNVRLMITSGGTIEWIKLYQGVFDESGEIIVKPEDYLIEDSRIGEDGYLKETYYYFRKEHLKGVTKLEQLIPEEKVNKLTYIHYKPVYNKGGQKVRTVTAKESNYFNILQTLAETFGVWMLIDVERNADGAVTKKKVKFVNYIEKENPITFRYGLNLKEIQRTNASKNIVTKLVVKQNSNEHGKDGFCTIARAGSNPTGENYIYDFQYFFNMGLLDAKDYYDRLYLENPKKAYIDENEKVAYENQEITDPLQGYFPRLKSINEQMIEKSTKANNIAQDILKYSADLELAIAGVEAATSEAERYKEQRDKCKRNTSQWTRLDTQYRAMVCEKNKFAKQKAKAEQYLAQKHVQYDTLIEDLYGNVSGTRIGLNGQKRVLNQEFFKSYARFIQEGTWINEECVDDEKYYYDAQSVLYNSCYPQVAYTINVISLNGTKGYELIKFDLGDKTYVEDPEFFGEEGRASVIVTEYKRNLDNPTKDTISVKNFKDSFQDLFQKITATVQQTNYSTGAYQKAVALAEAEQGRKYEFLSDALDGASAKLATAGQQTVTWGNDGISVVDADTPGDAIKIVGGAILLSKQDENGQQKWSTGMTADGIAADKITAGTVNTAEVTIMDGSTPKFRWDKDGISAYSDDSYNTFVRFSDDGLNGYSGLVDGDFINDQLNSDAEAKKRFHLGWDGFKSTTKDGEAELQFGHSEDELLSIKKKDGTNILKVDDSGNLTMKGDITAGNRSTITGGKVSGATIIGGSISASTEIQTPILMSPIVQYGENAKIMKGASYSKAVSVLYKITNPSHEPTSDQFDIEVTCQLSKVEGLVAPVTLSIYTYFYLAQETIEGAMLTEKINKSSVYNDSKELITLSYNGIVNDQYTYIGYVENIEFNTLDYGSTENFYCSLDADAEGDLIADIKDEVSYSTTKEFEFPEGGTLWGTWVIDGSLTQKQTIGYSLRPPVIPSPEAYESFYQSISPVSYADEATATFGYNPTQMLRAMASAGLDPETHSLVSENGVSIFEMIAFNTWYIQQLQQKITALEERITNLEAGTT